MKLKRKKGMKFRQELGFVPAENRLKIDYELGISVRNTPRITHATSKLGNWLDMKIVCV